MNAIPGDRLVAICDMLWSGHTIAAICLATGAAKGTVCRYKEILGVRDAAPELRLNINARWGQRDMDLLYKLALSKVDLESAADALGRAPAAIAHRALDYRIKLPMDWYRLIYPVTSVQLLNFQYPYLVSKLKDASDLLAVNALVPHDMPGREDVCQDVMLALAESRSNLAELRRDPKLLQKFISTFRRASFERSGRGVVSLDEPNQYGESKLEFMNMHTPILDGVDGIYFTHHQDFSDSLIDEISEEEERLGVPAALWQL